MNILWIWLILFLVYIYPFVFYPLVLVIILYTKRFIIALSGNRKKFNVFEDKEFESMNKPEWPSVTMIISAYNEGDIIEKKIYNSLHLEYPKSKLEVIVVSDGSTDDTDRIVKEFSDKGVLLVRVEGRRGKTACQNIAVERAKGEFIVFSDANSLYDKYAVKYLISRLLLSHNVGCVSGQLFYIEDGGSQKEGLYWKYETFLKNIESDLYSEIGVNGSIYALRKKDYIPLRGDLISDFVEPLEILRIKNKVTKHCGSAKAYENEPAVSVKKSVNRKRRIFVRAIRGLFYERELLNPFMHPVISFELISHKMCRWISPIVGLIMLFVPFLDIKRLFLIGGAEYTLLFVAILELFGVFNKFHGILRKATKFLGYFLVLNISDLIGWVDLIKGKKYVVWEVKR